MKRYVTVLCVAIIVGVAGDSHAEPSQALDSLAACDVLVVFAHPDDETMCAGTLAMLAEEGKSIQLVYATSGEAASLDKTGRGLTGPPLAEEREREMACAAQALGIERAPLFLRFPDGGVYEEREDLTAQIVEVFNATTPEVVISFGPDGGYGHPDHVAVGDVVERAFDATGAADRLLHVALSQKRFDVWVEITGERRFRPVANELVGIVVDVKAYLDQRMAAMACHATQFNDQQRMGFKVFAERTGTDEYVIARRPVGKVDGRVLD